MRLYTIGFTKSSAEDFFGRLKRAGVRAIADVRLRNDSQLAGFAKKDDLAWFAGALLGASYAHLEPLAPTDELLDGIRKKGLSWADYETRYVALIRQRKVERTLDPKALDGACLLCSEDKPHRCHRRLAAEYLQRHWPKVEIVHL